jgi:hypothetical protein
MKGIVFTEFIEWAEDAIGSAPVDRAIVEAELPSGGSYTAVGSYDHTELVALVVRLSELSEVPVPDIVRGFGHHLFGRFVVAYPQFFTHARGTIPFLERIESYIHAEVRKLYPDADLPHFDVVRTDGGGMQLVYRSSRHLADLAEGLILGCAEHFGDEVELKREDLSSGVEQVVRFTIRQRPEARV